LCFAGLSGARKLQDDEMTDIKFYAAHDRVSKQYLVKGGKLSNELKANCLWAAKGHVKSAITNFKQMCLWSHRSAPPSRYHIVFDIIEYNLDSGFVIDTYEGNPR
jgi:hypothetical protein